MMAIPSEHTDGPETQAKAVDRWLLPVGGRLVVVAGLAVSAWDAFVLRHETNIYGGVASAGLVLLFLGLGIYIAGRATLGKLYSEKVKIRPGHQLVTRGLYRYVRHPMYLGVILFVLSAPMILTSLYGFIIMLLLVPMLVRRIGIEEKALVSEFGEEYLEYARRTKKLIPYLY